MKIRVSDHALIRYMERVHGYDLAPLRDELSKKISTAAAVGAKNFKDNGFIYTLAYEADSVVVVTVLSNEMRENTRKIHTVRKRSI